MLLKTSWFGSEAVVGDPRSQVAREVARGTLGEAAAQSPGRDLGLISWPLSFSQLVIRGHLLPGVGRAHVCLVSLERGAPQHWGRGLPGCRTLLGPWGSLLTRRKLRPGGDGAQRHMGMWPSWTP